MVFAEIVSYHGCNVLVVQCTHDALRTAAMGKSDMCEVLGGSGNGTVSAKAWEAYENVISTFICVFVFVCDDVD